MMLPYKYALFAVFLLGQFNPSFQQINWISLIAKAAGANDVVTLAISAVDFISGRQSASGTLLNDIKESISNSKTEILNDILLQSRFDKIDDAVRSIHSSLTDFEAYLEASPNETEARKQEYVSRFDDNSVISYIRFLPELLTYSIPGTTGQTLISLFTENAACDKTKMKNFQAFYLHVISDGVALEVIHSKFKNLDPSKSVDDWAEKMVTILAIFQKADDECWCSGNSQSSDNCDSDIKLSKGSFAAIVICSFIAPIVTGLCVWCCRCCCKDDD